MIFSDNMVIPVGAPNPTAAEHGMNLSTTRRIRPDHRTTILPEPRFGRQADPPEIRPDPAKSHHLPVEAVHRECEHGAGAQHKLS